ncbi:MAG: hypothetical protein PVSMB6_15080 [Steroidobacteraceae bacterium]
MSARMTTPRMLIPVITLCLLAGSAARGAGAPATAAAAAAGVAPGCLAAGNGYLRARIRGALDLDLAWRNAELECEGGPRPDGSGLRITFAGPQHKDGRRTRLVFGIESVREGQAGRELPTNLTIIFEGEERLFATRGDSRCTIDALSQERVGALGGGARTWRVVARGFCVDPASTLDNSARIMVSRFDFAGMVVFADEVR